MSFVTAFMTLTTVFVLLAPVAMVVILVTGGVSIRQPATASVRATDKVADGVVADLPVAA